MAAGTGRRHGNRCKGGRCDCPCGRLLQQGSRTAQRSGLLRKQPNTERWSLMGACLRSGAASSLKRLGC
jgi:hypothetical protein